MVSSTRSSPENSQDGHKEAKVQNLGPYGTNLVTMGGCALPRSITPHASEQTTCTYESFGTISFFFQILRRMGKNKAQAHHTSTYFHTRRVLQKMTELTVMSWSISVAYSSKQSVLRQCAIFGVVRHTPALVRRPRKIEVHSIPYRSMLLQVPVG